VSSGSNCNGHSQFSLSSTQNQTGTARTTYAYDGDGLRRRMVTSGGTPTYVWDGTDYLQERT